MDSFHNAVKTGIYASTRVNSCIGDHHQSNRRLPEKLGLGRRRNKVPRAARRHRCLPPRRNRRQRKRLRGAPFATLARARRPRPSRAPPDAQLCPRAARGDAARRALRAGNFSGRGGATAVLTAVACVFSTRCPQIGGTEWRESLSMRRSMHGLSLPAPIGAAGRVRLPIAARCGFCSTVCPI